MRRRNLALWAYAHMVRTEKNQNEKCFDTLVHLKWLQVICASTSEYRWGIHLAHLLSPNIRSVQTWACLWRGGTKRDHILREKQRAVMNCFIKKALVDVWPSQSSHVPVAWLMATVQYSTSFPLLKILLISYTWWLYSVGRIWINH